MFVQLCHPPSLFHLLTHDVILAICLIFLTRTIRVIPIAYKYNVVILAVLARPFELPDKKIIRFWGL